MIQDYSNMHLCVIDNNNFIQSALELSKYFGKVSYFTPFVSDFPMSNDRLFGAGLENYWGPGRGVTRVDSFWDIRNKVDLFFFPDIYHADAATVLKDLGKNVFSTFYADELEIYREESKKYFAGLGLPVIPYEVVYGFSELRKYVQQNVGEGKRIKKVWIKIDGRNRGDCETFDIEDYDLSKNFLDELEFKLGALSGTYKFLVEENLEGDDKNPVVETGSDTFTIDGRFPENAMMGLEIKGFCYLSHWGKWSKFPREVTEFNTAIAPTLQKYGCRNFISTETRVRKEHGENVAYMLDFAPRLGHPPNEIELVMIRNLPDIIHYGSQGELIEPITEKKFGAQLNLHSSWAAKGTQVVKFAPELRESVRLRRLACIEDQLYVIPRGQGNTGIGCIAVEGDSWEDCIKQIEKIAPMVKGDCIEKKTEALGDAKEEIEKLKNMGINILDIE